MAHPLTARQRRATAAAAYRPAHVRLLLVAEAPPEALDRYFYFDRVPDHDHLFREVVRVFLDEEPVRDKARQLRQLQNLGVFLIDLKLDPRSRRRENLAAHVADLVKRVQQHEPEHVILIKANVYDIAFKTLHDRGVPVVDARIPFPASGRQGEFRERMRAALTAIG